MRTHYRTQSFPSRHRQAGAALVVGLIFIVLLTMLGISAFGISSLEERMAGHSRDRMLAFQAAEAALRDCEDNGLANGYVVYNSQNPARWSSGNAVWTGTNSTSYTGTVTGVSAAPRCILEEMERQECVVGGSLASHTATSGSFLYRVTARGVGSSPNTVVMLQTVFHACN
ncbi:MAG TPA: PilX N-terminal domain-containing pilus assembly protein [Thiobacillaceae bacterium]|nr:PilX N-terminal domain-containing pilus assembly protein [Thiobacillaceae bacterium]